MTDTMEKNTADTGHTAIDTARIAPLLQQAFNFHRQGHFTQAKAFYNQVLAVQPDNFDAMHLSGVLADQNGNPEEAVELIGRAITAISESGSINASHADAYYNLGNALQKLSQYRDAATSYQLALKLRPDNVDAYHSLGYAFNELKMHEAALASYQRAYELQPDYECLFGFRMRSKLLLCEWTGIEREIGELAERIDNGEINPPFTALAVIDDPARQRKAAETWSAEQIKNLAPLPPPAVRPPSGKIRIGYFSADFRNHPVGLLIGDLIESHNRAEFEIYGFAYGPEAAEDPVALRLNSLFDHMADLRNLTNLQAAQLARNLHIDIAVDLNGHTAHNRTAIFALRAAPVQINYLGYPGTSGTHYLDYIIADRTVIPERDKIHYSEKVAYLPHSYQINGPRPTCHGEASRSQFGLPEQAVVFCCFNNSYKIIPEVFHSWMRILQAVENSVLWLPAGKTARQNLVQAAQDQGIAANRLIFAERLESMEQHLSRQKLADLFLDTAPYNAHATAGDALWAGLPVLTCTGNTFAGRVAASLLKALDLPELITENRSQFEARAIELASHPERLAAIRRKLQDNSAGTPLFDVRQYTTALETAYTAMHQRSQAGLPPQDMAV